MQVLTRELSQFIDSYVSDHMHIPLELLMENAGRDIADALIGSFFENNQTGNVLFVCGTGNNGADGLVAARHLLEQDVSIFVTVVGNPTKGSPLFQKQMSILESLDCEIIDFNEFNDWSQVSVVVEGLMGTGFVGAMKPHTGDILHRIDVERTQYGFPLWAIDVPAGLDATTGQISEFTIPYDCTITFGSIKEGLLLYPGKDMAGTVIVAPLGIPWQKVLEQASSTIQHFTLDEALCKLIITDRLPQAHKGINGSALLIGGSHTMIGAPIMSAEAAVHSGAGKVSLIVPPDIHRTVQSKIIPEVMVQSVDAINTMTFENYQAISIGPGLGRTVEAKEIVESTLNRVSSPIVIDADGLYALGTIGSVQADLDTQTIHYVPYSTYNQCIMTPHLGEFSRLINKPVSYIEKHYVELASAFSIAHHVVLILKGIPTIVALPDGTVYINTLGNPGMGTGGMGDVLTGIVTSFVAQGYSLADAAVLAVYLHSRSGDLLSETKPWGYTPSDVSEHIGYVINELLKG